MLRRQFQRGAQRFHRFVHGEARRVGNSVVYGQTQLLFTDGSGLAVFDAAVAYTSGADIAEADRQRQQAYTVI